MILNRQRRSPRPAGSLLSSLLRGAARRRPAQRRLRHRLTGHQAAETLEDRTLLTPDLAPFTPPGWSDSIVISTQTGTNTDDSPVLDTDNVYIDVAWENLGDMATGAEYSVQLLLDGNHALTIAAPNTIAGGRISSEDFDLGALSVGQHTIELIVDSNDDIGEGDENNNTASRTFSVTVVPELSLSLSPTTMSENGGTVTATVSRNTGTTGALTVNIASDDTTEATVPATVTIPDGFSGTTFTVQAVDDLLVDGSQTANISVSAATFTGDSAAVNVTDDESPALTLSLAPGAMSENGGSSTLTITRNDTVGPVTVNLSSDDTSEATVQGTVTLPDGVASTTVTVFAVDDAIADGTQTATITGSAAGFSDGSDSVDVTDDEVATLSLSLDMGAILENGGTATGTILRNTDGSGDLTVNLSSTDTTEATVPMTVTIPDGATSATFTVTGVDDATIDGTQTVDISAGAAGFVGDTDSIDVLDDDAPALTVTVSPDAVNENWGFSAGTVTRNTDTSTALTVNLMSDDTSEAVVQASVTIAAGFNAATFTVFAVDDLFSDGDQTVTISASAPGFLPGSDTIVIEDNEVELKELFLNEILIDPPNVDRPNEFIELRGTPNATLSQDTYLVVIEGDFGEGTVDHIFDLGGMTIGSNGYLVLTQVGSPYAFDPGANVVESGTGTGWGTEFSSREADLENGSSSFLLIESTLAPIPGTDIDSLNNGTLDGAASNWDVIDSIGILDGDANNTAYGRINYSADADGSSQTGPIFDLEDLTGTAYTPDYVARAGDSTASTFSDWVVSDLVGTLPNFSLAFNQVGETVPTGTTGDVNHIGSTNAFNLPDRLTVSITECELDEGGGGASTVVVTRHGSIVGNLDVTLTNGDASEIAIPTSVTILDGQRSATFVVAAVDDALDDGTQTASITASAAGFLDGTDLIDILDDDDAALTLTIAPDTVSETDGAAAAVGTVSRNSEDLSSSLLVTLSNDDPTEASVPLSVTIPMGQASATFDIDAVDDGIADGTQTATLTASAAGFLDGSDTLDVTDDEVPTIFLGTVAPISENGGSVQMLVSRNTPPVGDLTVILSSDDTSEATVPPSIVIPDGDTTAPFTITAVDDAIDDGDQTVNILATAAGFVDGMQTVTVLDDDDPTLTLTIVEDEMPENGGTASASVSHNLDPTTSMDLTVTLTSDDTGEAGVPMSVTIPAGDNSAMFIIAAVDDALVDGTQTVSITASATGLASGSDTIDVTDDDVLTLSVTIADDSIDETDGINATSALIESNLEGGVLADLTITLQSDDTTEATVFPTTATIMAGNTDVTVNIDAQDDTLVDGDQTVTIVAMAAGYVDGSDTLDVIDNEAPTLSLSISPGTIGESGTATGTVTRNTPNTSDLVISLSSSDTSEAGVPPTVTIPTGSFSAMFTISGVDDALVDGTQSAVITASSAGFTDGTDTITVLDEDTATLTLSIDLASISENGGTATGTVTRNTLGDLTVALSSDDTTGATVPPSVFIPDGDTSATFTITAVDDMIVDGTQTVTITGSAGGFADAIDTIDITDDDGPTLTFGGLDIMTLNEGDTLTVTGLLTRNTGTSGDLNVTLTSSDTSEATVTAMVTIPDGSTTADFTVTAVLDGIVDGNQPVTITASAAGFVSATDDFDVVDIDTPTLTITIAEDDISENGGSSTATVSHNLDPTTSAALTVNLSSDDTTAATVPPTVTIPANQASATFTIDAVDDAVVDGTQTATITAGAAGFTDVTDTIDVTDDDVPTLSFLLDHIGIHEGFGIANSVSRNTGTSGDLTVMLMSSDTSEFTVPTSVTIPDGFSTASFTITTIDDGLDDGDIPVTVTASAAGFVDGVDNFDVLDVNVAQLTVSIAASVSEGDGPAATTATVTRNTDTTNALTVTLSSNDTTEATVPTTVTIPAGSATSSPFDIDAVDDAIVDGTQTATVTATATGHFDGTDTLDVTDDDVAELTVTIAAASISEADGAGATTATVSRNTDTTNALTVNLASSDTSEATVPASVTIPAGQSTSAPFAIDAVDDLLVDGTQTVTITATDAGHADGTDTIDVTDDDVATLTLSIAQPSISENGGSSTVTVTRNTAAVGDLTVSLSSNDTTEATVPPTVTIADMDTSATFTVTAVDDALLDGVQTVTLTASAGGFVDGNDTLNVIDDDIPSMFFDFGTDSSPVEAGATQVTPSTAFDPGLGYGWLGVTSPFGAIESRDRANVFDDLDRDYNLIRIGGMEFGAVVANGDYNVSVTIGSGADPRNNVGVLLEGVQVDQVSTPQNTFSTTTYPVTVTDGVLNLIIDRQGNTSASINALEILPLGGDPVIITTPAPLTYVAGDPPTPIDAGLTVFDLDDPLLDGGAVVITDGFNPAEDHLGFVDQNGITGSYDAGIGLLTLTGTASVADYQAALRSVTYHNANSATLASMRRIVFSATDGTGTGLGLRDISIVEPLMGTSFNFDFGTEMSPIEAGFIGVANTDEFNGGLGYGWLNTSGLQARNYSIPDSLTRDFAKIGLGNTRTFAVDLADGLYDVTVTVGAAFNALNGVTISLEGTQVTQISSASGSFVTETHTVLVTDGRLEVDVSALGTTGGAINGLQIAPSAPPPPPISAPPQGLDDLFGDDSGMDLLAGI